MTPQFFLLVFSASGIALFVLAVILLALSKEGRIIASAKLMKNDVLIKIRPTSRTITLEKIPKNELVVKNGNVHFLGGWPNYRWGGVRAFFVIEDDVTDYDPKVVAEIQKATSEGIDTFEKLKEMTITKVREEIPVKTKDGKETTQVVEYVQFKPILGRAHRVLNVRPIKKGKGMSIEIEEYTPIDFGVVADFYNRKLRGDAIKKILKLKDIECLEKVEKVYTNLLKKMKVGIKTGGGIGFNPVWLIYFGIFVFIVLMGWSMYGGKIGLPPSP